MGNSNKKSNYIVQGGILAAASILVRIIGMVYRIPVTRILGPIGNSYYSAAYEVYSMMLLISSFSGFGQAWRDGVRMGDLWASDRNDPSGYFKYRCLQYQRHH